ncbi:hypothetical protein ACQPZ2_12825 [Nocardia pseudovaccinii]|uniref:hypothetical protein n=1 Tax=Nocardia pseudovaccinii TaxID=189540 RepID=UPI003D91855F
MVEVITPEDSRTGLRAPSTTRHRLRAQGAWCRRLAAVVRVDLDTEFGSSAASAGSDAASASDCRPRVLVAALFIAAEPSSKPV